VLELAQAPRAARLPLDILNGIYPSDQDVVLLANVLHLFGEPACRRILTKASAALRPGGRLVVKDLHIDAARTGPAESVLFALNMALFTEAGDVHDGDTLSRWISDTGLPPPSRVALQTSPNSVVLVSQSLDLPTPSP
jgi:hypothetical protein